MTETIPNSLMTAYIDAISHAEESDYLPASPNDYRVNAHFHALDRACHNDIQYLSRILSAVDIEDEDPDAVEFLRQSLMSAKRLRLWNIEAFNQAPPVEHPHRWGLNKDWDGAALAKENTESLARMWAWEHKADA